MENTMTLTADKVTLRSPEHLVANIPNLLGFTPTDSLIAVWLKDGHILVTQRADQGPALDDLDALFGPMYQHDPDEVILVLWGGEWSAVQADQLIEHARTLCTVRDALWVNQNDDTFGSVMCRDFECCPPGGKPIRPELVEGMLAGDPGPLSHRETLVDETKPVGTERMKALTKRGEAREAWRDKAIDNAIILFENVTPASERDLVKVGRSLHDIRVRDTLLWYANGLEDIEAKRHAYELAASVARVMHPEDATPALTIASILAWVTGDGARANVAIDHADHDYSLAGLVRMSLQSGLPPTEWAAAMSHLTFPTVRHGK
jgi:hypothetical protein